MCRKMHFMPREGKDARTSSLSLLDKPQSYSTFCLISSHGSKSWRGDRGALSNLLWACIDYRSICHIPTPSWIICRGPWSFDRYYQWILHGSLWITIGVGFFSFLFLGRFVSFKDFLDRIRAEFDFSLRTFVSLQPYTPRGPTPPHGPLHHLMDHLFVGHLLPFDLSVIFNVFKFFKVFLCF